MSQPEPCGHKFINGVFAICEYYPEISAAELAHNLQACAAGVTGRRQVAVTADYRYGRKLPYALRYRFEYGSALSTVGQ